MGEPSRIAKDVSPRLQKGTSPRAETSRKPSVDSPSGPHDGSSPGSQKHSSTVLQSDSSLRPTRQASPTEDISIATDRTISPASYLIEMIDPLPRMEERNAVQDTDNSESTLKYNLASLLEKISPRAPAPSSSISPSNVSSLTASPRMTARASSFPHQSRSAASSVNSSPRDTLGDSVGDLVGDQPPSSIREDYDTFTALRSGGQDLSVGSRSQMVGVAQPNKRRQSVWSNPVDRHQLDELESGKLSGELFTGLKLTL